MNNKKIIPGIVLFLGLIIFIYHIVLDDYGLPYNAERIKKGIPIIPSDWVTDGSFKFASQNWYPKEDKINNLVNYHSFKQIRCSFGRIEYESDKFILEKGKGILSLTYTHGNKTKPWLITYYLTGKGGGDISKEISYESALDLLQKHNIDLKLLKK